MRSPKFNASFLSLLFLSIVTIGIIVGLLIKTFPLFAAKAIYYCQQFISTTLFQIPHFLHYLVILALAIALGIGVLSFLVQLVKTDRLRKRLLAKKASVPEEVQKTLIPLGLADKVDLIKNNNLFSLCFGILSPRIIITTGLVSTLTQKELEAVLLHEQAHMKNFDPLKILLGKTATSMFFFLPIFREFNRNMNATNELIADEWVITSQKETTFLRRALKKILSRPHTAFATFPAVSNPDYLEIRIRRIVNAPVKYNPSISLISILTCLMFFVVSWVLLQTQVYAFQTNQSTEPSYFLCSSESSCSDQCQQSAQTSRITSPEYLFFSQSLKYEAPTHR